MDMAGTLYEYPRRVIVRRPPVNRIGRVLAWRPYELELRAGVRLTNNLSASICLNSVHVSAILRMRRCMCPE